MSMHRTWKTCLGVFFLLAIMCLVMQPAFAAGKSKNKDKDSAGVETPPQTHQEKVEQILANTSGPPINPIPIPYYKFVPGNDKILVKDFKNGHPNINSGWTPCPDGVCPYAQ